MRLATLFLALLSAALLIGVGAGRVGGAAKEDTLIRALVSEYYDSWHLKMDSTESTDLEALSWFLASRVRRSEEWRPVLDRARGGCRRSIRMMGLMLAREAKEREAVERLRQYHESGPHEVPFAARDPVQRSDIRDQVVPVLRELLGSAPAPDLRVEVVLALVRSRHPELKEDCLRMLEAQDRNRGERFYAAAGLARLGVEAGTDWLEQHRKERELLPVPPAGAASRSLADGCARLLEHPDAPFVESLTWTP